MERRTYLAACIATSGVPLAGCADGMLHQEQGKDNEIHDENETGTPSVDVRVKVVEDYPDGISPVKSGNGHILRMEMFTEAMEFLEEGDGISIGDEVTITESPRDTTRARDALTAKEELPQHELNRTYVTHSSHVLSLEIRLSHED